MEINIPKALEMIQKETVFGVAAESSVALLNLYNGILDINHNIEAIKKGRLLTELLFGLLHKFYTNRSFSAEFQKYDAQIYSTLRNAFLPKDEGYEDVTDPQVAEKIKHLEFQCIAFRFSDSIKTTRTTLQEILDKPQEKNWSDSDYCQSFFNKIAHLTRHQRKMEPLPKSDF